MKTPKLIAGQMNCLFTKLEANYAHGVNRPKKELKKQVKPLVIKVRRQEGLMF